MNPCRKPSLFKGTLTAILFVAAVFCALPDTDSWAKTVYVIPVSGTVDPGMASFIKRSFSPERTPAKDALYVLEMNTFGGRVDSALEIVDTLLKIPKDRTVAYVSDKAISAGALIALSCGRLYMKPHTTIGDCAPITYSNEGPKLMGEKFQSPLRAKFRALAKRNGYPETLAEAMVTPDMVVHEITVDGQKRFIDQHALDDMSEETKAEITRKRTVVSKGELLTMDDVESEALGFSKGSPAGIEQLLAELNLDDAEVVRISETWSESMVRFLGTIIPLLILIGLAALYTEIQAPGFGVPGIIGILCLSIVFFNQYLIGLADYAELAALLLGIILLAMELFVIPGFGIAGFAGITCIIVGMVLSLQDFVLPDPSMPWEKELLVINILKVLGSFTGAIILGLLTFRYLLPRYGKSIEGPYLAATLRESRVDSSEVLWTAVGDTGTVATFLRPSGKAKIKGEVINVISEGEFLEKGTPVIVTKIKGNRIIVSEITDI